MRPGMLLANAMAVALGGVSSAHAVHLNPRGLGQVLIYPYYTVNHQQTLLSVVNSTPNGKALKLRFREAYDGREVAGFNVYLGPFDSWVGAVFGTLLVNFAKTFFSEEYPDLWLFLMGATFIAVVLLFPDGLAGLYERHGKPLVTRLMRGRAPKRVEATVPVTAALESGGKHG